MFTYYEIVVSHTGTKIIYLIDVHQCVTLFVVGGRHRSVVKAMHLVRTIL